MISRRFHKYLKAFEKKRVRENADKKNMGLCYRSQKRICSKKEEDISIVKNREGGSTGVFEGLVMEGVYSTIKITIDVTSVLWNKEGWKEENGAELLIFE